MPKAPAPRTEDTLREEHMLAVRNAVASRLPNALDSLATEGFAIVDDFLPPGTITVLRGEAEALRVNGNMVASESSRWNEASGKVERYEKRNVLSTNLIGGESYFQAPRLTEYCVAMVSSIPRIVNPRFDNVSLCDRLHTNKLAVCLGDGSFYHKHYDNSGVQTGHSVIQKNSEDD